MSTPAQSASIALDLMNLKNTAVNLFVLASLCVAASFATNLSFQLPPRDYAAGPSPFAVTVADFNGDGIPDLAVSGGASVSILLGKGKGEFRSPVTYSTGGAQPWNIVAADFNGDGHLDLAVGQGNRVSVLLGNGDGTFGAASQPLKGPIGYVAAGDFNGDGKVDLAAANYQTGAVELMLGNGDGTFGAPAKIAATSGAIGLAAVKLNGDGNLDLVVCGAGAMAVLLGKGDGTFRPVVTYSATLNGPLAVADVNGDGLPDVVASSAAGVLVFLGSGNGKFSSPLPAFGSSAMEQVAIADFNGDGVKDLAAPLFSGSGGVQIYLGNGDGTFSAGQLVPTASSPYWVTAARLNDDKAIDLVSADSSGGAVSVLLGHGDGTFGAPVLSLGPGASGATGIAAGDVNGDGILDLVTSNSSGNVSVLLGRGKGEFAPGLVFRTGSQPKSVALGDFNHDGKLDIVTANFGSGSVSVLFGNGDGTFQAPKSMKVGVQTQSVAVGDMNNDGIPDIVVASVQSGTVSTLLSNGDGTFQSPIVYSINNGYAGMTWIALGDINGDGNLDVTGEYSFGSGLQVLDGQGNGSLALLTGIYGPPYPSGVAIADFNHDGVPDIAFATSNAGMNSRIGVSLNHGGGLLSPPVYSTAPVSPTLLGAADFDGDGFPDVVSTGLNSNVLTFAMGNGDGSFSSGPAYPTYQPSAVAVADLNRDGRPDLAVAQPNGVEILINTTPK